jgi:hypothetical protein
MSQSSPRLPAVAGSNKPPGWKRWRPAGKAEHLLGLSLDRMHDYLSWSADDLDPHRLAAQTQVIRVVVMVAAAELIGEHAFDLGSERVLLVVGRLGVISWFAVVAWLRSALVGLVKSIYGACEMPACLHR